MLVLDGMRPRRDGVGALHDDRRPTLVGAPVAPRPQPVARAQAFRFAQVVEEHVDRRLGELPRPFARRRVERDLDTLEAVALEILAQQRAQGLVEVGQHGVERHVDGQQHSATLTTAGALRGKIPGVTETAYDAVRYSNFPYAQTHPARLATVAILHGLEVPDPQHGSVLELGCGAGANLIAMATATPGVRALGVDLAAGPIAEGQAAIAAIGLPNVVLRQGDVRTLTDGRLGTFDYVVAHGVYGWMPADANDALLAVIAAALAPDGVAYVSYNAQPGGYFRRMLRDVGLWHARAAPDALARAAKAQELYRFLKERRVSDADTYGALLAREVPSLADGPLYRLVHDDLGEHWEPVWFADFAAHAARHGL